MITNVDALKVLYVKLGGSLTDTYSDIANGIAVGGYDLIADCISACAKKAPTVPTVTGQSGKFLTNNGTAMSWADAPTEIPSQTSQNGKFLTTNGTVLSWGSIPVELPAYDAEKAGYILTVNETGTGVEWVNPNP